MNVDNTFLLSDTHFDHKEIIKYCNRPFNDVDEMNRTIIRNYNRAINRDSLVFILGDISFGHKSAGYWLSMLNGKKVYIYGNHDINHNIQGQVSVILSINSNIFCLVHDSYFTKQWADWTICGHFHNADYIDRTKKMVNVSVETIGYNPISMRKILTDIGV